MARMKNGILGGFSGQISNIVGYYIGDNFYIRTKPSKPKKFTNNELANQAKFKLVTNFIKPFKDLLKVGFKNYYTPMGGIRGAISYTLKNCIRDTNEGIKIDPLLVKISGGQLPQAINPLLSFNQPNDLILTWENSSNANGNDQLILLVHDLVNAKAAYLIFDGPMRKEQKLIYQLPKELMNQTIDVYIGFIAADRSSQSDSQYLGSFIFS